MIFHLTSEKLWNDSLTSEYRPESLGREGFIHFSTLGQIITVANSFYKNCEDAVLLAVANEPLEELKWEGEDGLEFPHLYRALKAQDVITVLKLPRSADGHFELSKEIEEAAGAITLNTDRLLLREFHLSDKDSVHDYASNDEIVKYMPWGPNSVTDTRAFFTRKFKEQCVNRRTNFDLAVVDKSTGEFLGSVGIIVRSFESRVAHIGYILKKSAHGKGFATEFSKKIIEFGFKNLNLYRIEATCDAENAASFKVMQKIGMQKEGVLRGNQVFKNRRRDTIMCSILKAT